MQGQYANPNGILYTIGKQREGVGNVKAVLLSAQKQNAEEETEGVTLGDLYAA